MSVVMVLLIVLPLVATLVCLRAPHRVAAAVTALTGIISFILAVALVPAAKGHTITGLHYLRADALSVIFLLGTCFLYAAVGVYSVGYLADEERAVRSETAEQQALFARHSARFYLGLNAFAWSMICAPLVNGLALLWIAIEITTVVSALLVALDNTEGATEAAWKYVLIASSGLGIALLATIFMYYAGAKALGQSYDLAFDPLISAAAQLPQTPVRLAFVLAVVGFGTKVGFFPVHTWLPDAHAEAPTPVSALLSGSLLAVSFYAILRYYQIATGTLGTRFPQIVLLVFGVLSLTAGRAVFARTTRHQTAACLFKRRTHGHPRDRHQLRRTDRLVGSVVACAGPRRSQGQRIHGRRSAGAQVRDQGTEPDDAGDRVAALVGAIVPNRGAGVVGDASIRVVPQRISDRDRWFRPRPQRVDRRTGMPGDAGISGSEPGDDTDSVPPRTRRLDRRCVGTDRVVNPANGWWHPSSPECWCCWFWE